jgi:hypothetical protein
MPVLHESLHLESAPTNVPLFFLACQTSFAPLREVSQSVSASFVAVGTGDWLERNTRGPRAMQVLFVMGRRPMRFRRKKWFPKYGGIPIRPGILMA